VFLLCHPWFTTTNLSYTFPILETSATASCGTTGIVIILIIFSSVWLPLSDYPCQPLLGSFSTDICTFFFPLLLSLLSFPSTFSSYFSIHPRKLIWKRKYGGLEPIKPMSFPFHNEGWFSGCLAVRFPRCIPSPLRHLTANFPDPFFFVPDAGPGGF